MAEAETHVLLVEGFADRDFFNQVCKLLNLHKNPKIQVATPQDYQAQRNTKEDVFKLLPSFLKKIEDSDNHLEHLAIVVDADKLEHGSGYEKTIEKVKEIVKKHDFSLAENKENGLIFNHPDGLADFGLWIMPDNQKEGILENFIKHCIKIEEQQLFSHAVQVVENIPSKKFKSHHYAKAEIATWLAWQNPPGRGLYCSIEDNLLDTTHPLFQELERWLKQIFI